MTAHDANLTRFSQWWQRTRRAGHAYAEGAALHGASPEGFRRRETLRAVIWGLGLPLSILLCALIFGPLALGLVLIWPLQVLRLKGKGYDWTNAVFLTLGKFPEAHGILEFHLTKQDKAQRDRIEYK